MSDDGGADLHTHTDASDGTVPVAERLRLARERGLDTVAITDHDTISAPLPTRRALRDGLEIVTGVEVRADYEGAKIELLGYFVDPTDEQLQALLERVRQYRHERNEQLVANLVDETGLDLDYETLEAEANGTLGRPHLAARLVEAGLVDSIGAAFDEYLAEEGSVYVEMERVPYPEVIETLQSAGAVVSLAHPGRIRADATAVESMVADLAAVGLDAIEVWYPYGDSHSGGYAGLGVEDAAALAERHDLLSTGGSDCHGPDSGKFRIGDVRVPERAVDALRERASERRPFE
ncbi:MAG: PHP domain-containing protein [Haloarculaceae archaeon]